MEQEAEAVTAATIHSSLVAKTHAWEAGNLCPSSSSDLKRQNHIFPFPGGHTLTSGSTFHFSFWSNSAAKICGAREGEGKQGGGWQI